MNQSANAFISHLNTVAPISESERWLLGTAAVIVLFCLLLALAFFIHNFIKELHYLSMEIGRTHGEERRHYLRRRRRLWLSLIPFVRY